MAAKLRQGGYSASAAGLDQQQALISIKWALAASTCIHFDMEVARGNTKPYNVNFFLPSKMFNA